MALLTLPIPSIDYAAWAQRDYVADQIDLDQFEDEIEQILRGVIPTRMSMTGMLTRGELR